MLLVKCGELHETEEGLSALSHSFFSGQRWAMCICWWWEKSAWLRPGLMGKLYVEANIFKHVHACT